MTQERKAIALTSDIEKEECKEPQTWIIYPTLFQKINEKISGRSGNQRALLMYLIFQKQNSNFFPAEETICKYCGFTHNRYSEARKALQDEGFITYTPYKEICINYKKILE